MRSGEKKGKEKGVKALRKLLKYWWANPWCAEPLMALTSAPKAAETSQPYSILRLPGQGKRNSCIELIALCLGTKSTSQEAQKDRIYQLEIGLGGGKALLIDYYPNFCPENHGTWAVEHQLLPQSRKPEVKGCNWVLLLFFFYLFCYLSLGKKENRTITCSGESQ